MSDHYKRYKATIDRNTYLWRDAHKQEYLDYSKAYTKANFHLYKDAKNKKRNAKYQFNKEWQSLLSILVNMFD